VGGGQYQLSNGSIYAAFSKYNVESLRMSRPAWRKRGLALAAEKARILQNLAQHDLSGGIHQQVVTGDAET
jgi:hypothetical protein